MAPFLLLDSNSWPLNRWPRPSPTPVSSPTATHLYERQATVTVVATTDNGGGDHLSGGAIAGIVIGSIVGTILLLWIIRSCFNLGAPPQEREIFYNDVDPDRYRHHHHSRHRRHHSPEVSMSMPPPVVIREHSRNRHRSPRYVYTEEDPHALREKVRRGRRMSGH